MIRSLTRGDIMRRALRPRGFLYGREGPLWIHLMPRLAADVIVEMLADDQLVMSIEADGVRLEASPAARLEAEIVEDLERW